MLVIVVEPDSPADRAGMREDDTLISIDDLHRQLTEERIGRRCTLAVIRDVEQLALDVVPQERR